MVVSLSNFNICRSKCLLQSRPTLPFRHFLYPVPDSLMRFLYLLLLPLWACEAQAEDVVVQAMSFNIRTSLATADAAGTCSNWDGVRKSNVAAQITDVGADFIGTQETSDAQKAYLDSALAASYASIGKSGGSLNGAAPEWNAVYYKTSTWTLLSDGMFWLGPDPDTASAAWGMAYYRTCVYGRFQHISSGKTVCVMNTHYETPGNDEAQTQGSAIILARMASVCQASDSLTVLTGDFNALRSYPAMQALFTGGLVDASTDPTFCGDMLSSTCQTKFDFTLHTSSSAACLKQTKVLRQAFDSCYPSDHAALLSSYSLSGTDCTSSSSTGSSASSSVSGSSSSSTGTGSSSTSSNSTSTSFSTNFNTSGDDTQTAGTVKPSSSTDSYGSAGSDDEDETTTITTKSSGGSSATGTVMAIFGVLAAVGVVCALVVRRKRALQAHANGVKASMDTQPRFFAVVDSQPAMLSPSRRSSS